MLTIRSVVAPVETLAQEVAVVALAQAVRAQEEAVVALAALHWSYISRYAWTVGIDAASPEFTKYFRSLVWAELMVIGAGTGL